MHRYARLGVELAIDKVWPEKSTGRRKGAGSKIAVSPSIPTHIASDRIPSQYVSVGLAQARPNEVHCTAIDHFTYYCLGPQGGKLWVATRLLGPIACRNTARDTENDQSVVRNIESSASSFKFFSKPLVLTLPPPRPSLG